VCLCGEVSVEQGWTTVASSTPAHSMLLPPPDYEHCPLNCPGPQAADGMPGRSAVLMELRKLKLYAVQVGVHFGAVAALKQPAWLLTGIACPQKVVYMLHCMIGMKLWLNPLLLMGLALA
jgi:hypothetical protein